MSLKISKDLVLPVDAITQTFSILAQRRVGKTYTASVMAEEFVANSLPFAVLDPTGAWWGLRSSADGKSNGLPVVIIGGEHGDVPLEFTAGKVIADLVVDHPGYYVIDLSGTESNAQQDRFAADFAERLYRRKAKVRTPLHLFVDEADAFAPQRPLDGQQRMLGAFETLVRRGGIRGIGTTLITQRAAVLNKNVLTQTDSLFVLRMNSSQDQDAMEDWVKRNGTKEQKEAMMSSLASLPTGESWFWSPGWMRMFKKIHIRLRRTFNSSATPKAGEKILIPQKIAPVDLERLGKEIKDTIERAVENDPAELKKRISFLENLVRTREREVGTALSKPAAEKIKIVEIPVMSGEQQNLLETLSRLSERMLNDLGAAKQLFEGVPLVRRDILAKLATFHKPVAAPTPKFLVPPPKQVTALVSSILPTPHVWTDLPESAESDNVDPNKPLSKCETEILTALAQYLEGREVTQIAVLTGRSGTSGGFKNSLGSLRTKEFITRTHPVQITQAGLDKLGTWEPLPTGEALFNYWLEKLSTCESSILTALFQVHPNGLTPEELGKQTQRSHTSGGFKNSLGRLRTLELVQRGQPIKISDNFFQ